jgi:hypothetical protein
MSAIRPTSNPRNGIPEEKEAQMANRAGTPTMAKTPDASRAASEPNRKARANLCSAAKPSRQTVK